MKTETPGKDGRRPTGGGLRRHEVLLPPAHTFYVMAESPCPYLPGQLERKLFTELRPEDAGDFYASLSRGGFRRSHNFAYRPACTGCTACVPVRIDARAFVASRSLRRIARTNWDLVARERQARATTEQFRVFARYITTRHGDGEMASMSFGDYRSMVEESVLDTRLIEFRDADGDLVAGLLTDWSSDGASAVYSYFDPGQSGRSLGNYMVLWLVEECRRRGLPYVYLGYWIEGSRKMSYKARFQPLEKLGPSGWQKLEPGDDPA